MALNATNEYYSANNVVALVVAWAPPDNAGISFRLWFSSRKVGWVGSGGSPLSSSLPRRAAVQ